MNLESLSKLQTNSVVYNEETKEILLTSAVLTSDATNDDVLPCVTLQAKHSNGIKVADAAKWHQVNELAPAEIQLVVVNIRLTQLENFVTSRLK